MGFSLPSFFQQRRDDIIKEWVSRLKSEVGEQYAARDRSELYKTVTNAYDADVKALIEDDYAPINRFINHITRMRLDAGFLLSDVQKAFELFRTIVTPLLVKETSLEEFAEAIIRLNRCQSYTNHRFSDYFQSMHEKKIIGHNRRLEEEVRARTVELRESELKYKTLVEEINDGYFVVQNEVIVFANHAFCRMHGYRPDEVIGKNFLFFVSPENRKEVMEADHRQEGEKARGTLQYMRLNKDQSRSPTEMLSKNTRYGNMPSSIGICRDITGRVKMEHKMRESERMAYIGQITTSLSHEIRNPLSAVKMNLQILKKNPSISSDNDRRRIDISVREVKRLEDILQDLLDFAKPLQLKPDMHEINKILTASIELLEMKFKEQRITIIADLDPSLPKMNVDRQKMEQAFINILLNALESSPRGAAIEIATAANAAGDGTTEITIADEGHGVPAEHFSEIFKPFFTTKSRGTGLGLSNVRRIIQAHGGRIRVKNREPSGAFFKTTLPTCGYYE